VDSLRPNSVDFGSAPLLCDIPSLAIFPELHSLCNSVLAKVEHFCAWSPVRCAYNASISLAAAETGVRSRPFLSSPGGPELHANQPRSCLRL